MLDTKFDLAWVPKYDEDFRQWCKKFAAEFGWPKGSINAFSLWNEPWEGISIAGWGADMLRYREIFTAMCLGVEDARKEAGVEVLLGGGDSTSNALDKFFGDGADAYRRGADAAPDAHQHPQPPCLGHAGGEGGRPEGRACLAGAHVWAA